MSFGLPPLAGLEHRLKCSTYNGMPTVSTQKDYWIGGKSREAKESRIRRACPGQDGILNQNPIFESGYNSDFAGPQLGFNSTANNVMNVV